RSPISLLFFSCSCQSRVLLSFPTRRSSDLICAAGIPAGLFVFFSWRPSIDENGSGAMAAEHDRRICKLSDSLSGFCLADVRSSYAKQPAGKKRGGIFCDAGKI